MSPMTGRGVIGCVLLALLGCSPNAQPQPEAEPVEDVPESGPAWFEDVTDKVGLNFVHDAGPTGGYSLPQVMGSGAAFLDYDGDGRLDIYLLQNGGPDS